MPGMFSSIAEARVGISQAPRSCERRQGLRAGVLDELDAVDAQGVVGLGIGFSGRHQGLLRSRAISTTARRAVVYERQPSPCIVPSTTGEIIERWRHSSRAARFDRGTSMTGKGIAAIA